MHIFDECISIKLQWKERNFTHICYTRSNLLTIRNSTLCDMNIRVYNAVWKLQKEDTTINIHLFTCYKYVTR